MVPDLLIQNARMLSMVSPAEPWTEELYFLKIRAGVISEIGKMGMLTGGEAAGRRIDAAGALLMPGLVNTHTHAAMTLFRGLADDLPLMTWLQEHIFPAEARFVDEEMVYWCSKLAAAEMILSGTTTVADGYFYEDAAARAFCDAGIRAVAAQGVIDFPAPGVTDPLLNVDAAAAYVERWQGKNRLLTPAVFCHSPYTCSPETLVRAKELAAGAKVPYFIHLAETRQEVKLVQEKYGKSPVALLNDLGVLDRQTICVHCVWLSEEDLALLADSGAAVSSCPESNLKLASGTAPLERLRAKGVPVGLGTDGCASNNDLDMFGEMDACAKIHKGVTEDPTVMPARQVLEMATLTGATILGLGNETGSLVPGKLADCILVDLDQPHLTPFYHPDTLVYAACAADVRTAIINGEVVMENRRICTFDLAETMEKVRRLAGQVKKKPSS
jgi:5-methylthioadenosine/S-adenosylhomocysteine deaminase